MEETNIPWPRIAEFIRLHTHDVRNGLNSLELETAYLQELVTDDEPAASVERVRKQLRTVAQQLRALSALFQEPSPLKANVPASVLLKIWREKLAALPHAQDVHWRDKLGEEQVSVDVEMMGTVFRELLANAALYSPGEPLMITGRCTGGVVLFELSEPKQTALDPSNWGQPFSSSRRDHYGLGLWNVGRLLAACGASFVQSYVPEEGCLFSRITLPVV